MFTFIGFGDNFSHFGGGKQLTHTSQNAAVSNKILPWEFIY